MKVFLIIGMMGLFLISCGSTDKLTVKSNDYKQEYESSLASYNKTVDPQNYSNSNSSVLAPNEKIRINK